MAPVRPDAREVSRMTPKAERSAPRFRNQTIALRLIGHTLPWLAAIGVFFLAGSYLSLWTNALIMALLTLSLDLALGHAGIVTLGQAAFLGFGAYAAGLFGIYVSGDPLLGLVVATLLTALLGLLTGMLILHTSGITMLMLTLSISVLLFELANRFGNVTGGDDGLQGINMSPLLGVFDFDLFGQTAYLYTLTILFVWFIAAWRIVVSPFGLSVNGIRQSPARMRAIGTPVWRHLVVIYTISAAMAGTAGALSAQTTNSVGLNSLGLMMSGVALVMLVLGGQRRLYGAFLGAVLYVVVQDWAASVNPFYWMFVIGGMLIATVMFLDDGVMGLGTVMHEVFVPRQDRDDE
jgi:branched-chain amino acid transport system permease protein